jgi:hypothetical protein
MGPNTKLAWLPMKPLRFFGVRPVQAKALIKDGKIERWVYAKSGMEIQ